MMIDAEGVDQRDDLLSTTMQDWMARKVERLPRPDLGVDNDLFSCALAGEAEEASASKDMLGGGFMPTRLAKSIVSDV